MSDLMGIKRSKVENGILRSISWDYCCSYGSRVRTCQIVTVAHNFAMSSSRQHRASKKCGQIVHIVVHSSIMSLAGVGLCSKSSENNLIKRAFKCNLSDGLLSAHLPGSICNDDWVKSTNARRDQVKV